MATKRPRGEEQEEKVRVPRLKEQDTLLIMGDRGQNITGRTVVRLGEFLERLRTMPVKEYVEIQYNDRIPRCYKEYMDRPAHEFINKIRELQVAENKAIDAHNRKAAEATSKPRKAFKRRRKVDPIDAVEAWTVDHPDLRAFFNDFCRPDPEADYDIDDEGEFTLDHEPMRELFFCLYEHCIEHKLGTMHRLDARDMGSFAFLWTPRTLSGNEAHF